MHSVHLNNRKSMQQDVQLDVHFASNTSDLCCPLLLLYHLTDSRKHYPKYGFWFYDANHWTGRRKIWLRINLSYLLSRGPRWLLCNIIVYLHTTPAYPTVMYFFLTFDLCTSKQAPPFRIGTSHQKWRLRCPSEGYRLVIQWHQCGFNFPSS